MALIAIKDLLVTIVTLTLQRILPFLSTVTASLFSSQKSEFFTHESLKDPARDIRLLFLEPSLDIRGPIICTLKPFPCSEAPPYEAVSYHWGTSIQDQPITVNKQKAIITKSLKSALQDLRHPVESRILWVDGLCIDQSQKGLVERNVQVARMINIFSGALRVVAWLHSEDPVISKAFALTQKLAGCTTASEAFEVAGQSQNWMEATKFFELPWWTRVWVFQEIVVAKELLLRSGKRQLKWDSVYSFAYWIASIGHNSTLPVAMVPDQKMRMLIQSWTSTIIRLQFSRWCYQKEATLPLLNIISYQRGELHGATDPRDRVFAMLGLSTEHQYSNLGFTADYTKSVCETYTTFARALLQASASTKLLSFAGPHKEGSELPSWVPDWRYGSGRRDSAQLHSSVDTATGQMFNASGGYRANMKASKSSIITIEGIIIDQVDTICRKPSFNAALEFYNSYLSFSAGISNDLCQDSTWLTQAIESEIHIKHRPVYNDPMTLVRILLDDTWSPGSKDSVPRMTEIIVEHFRVWLRDQGPTVLRRALEEHELIQKEASIRTRILSNTWSENDAKDKLNLLRNISSNMIHTSKGYIGTTNVDDHVQIGDVICILLGGSVPYVLRGKGDHYILVGEAYVHGIMDGEVIDELKDGHHELEWISLK